MRMQCVYNFITNDDLGACLKYSLTFNHRNVMMIPPDFVQGLKPETTHFTRKVAWSSQMLETESKSCLF